MDYNQTINLYEELKPQFEEMSQIKSDFDMEKFTVKKYGKFLAHNYHFLMRQYSITLSEYQRKLLDIRHEERELEFYSNFTPPSRIKEGDTYIYTDIKIEQIKLKLNRLKLGLIDRKNRLEFFEKCRAKLVELHGRDFTNEDYQMEEPEFLKWWLKTQAIQQIKGKAIGVSEGVMRNISYLEEDTLLNDDFKVQMTNQLGLLDLSEFANDNANRLVPRPVPTERNPLPENLLQMKELMMRGR